VFVAILVRRLREGMTYEDFLDAWYPDEGFGFGGRGPITARSLEDERRALRAARRVRLLLRRDGAAGTARHVGLEADAGG
jgi:hypothetical protein